MALWNKSLRSALPFLGGLLHVLLQTPLPARGAPQEPPAPEVTTTASPPVIPTPTPDPTTPPETPSPSVANVEPPPVATATVSGRVVEKATGDGIYELTVQVAGRSQQTTTNEKGEFSLALPPGTYTLEFVSEFYDKLSLAITIPAVGNLVLAAPVALKLSGAPTEVTAETVVIREPDQKGAAAQLQSRREASTVSDSVSSEDIRKSADSSASQVASRVVGATVVGDRFVYVRGLGERYSSTLLHGLPLPSPEPEQHAVPFDIFPAELLSSLSVIKTATPDLPADFAGGAVEIALQDFPTKRVAHFGASIGGNSQTVFQPMLTYPGGRTDWLGIDDGTRRLPAGKPTGAALGRAFPNVWSPYRQKNGSPNYAVSASFGDRAEVRGKRIGYLFALHYSADSQTRAEEVQVLNLVDTGQGPQLRPLVQFGNDEGAFAAGAGRYSVRSTDGVNWGALGTVAVQLAPLHRISLTTLFSQSSDRETRIYQGFSQEQFSELWNSRLRFVARSLGLLQLRGNHHFEPAQRSASDLDWAASYSAAARDEPDNREVTYLKKDDGLFHFTPKGTSGQRFFANNLEHQVAARIDFSQGFKQWHGLASALKIGVAGRVRIRDFSARRFKFGFGGIGDIDDTAAPEQLFSAEHLGTAVEVRENTNTADKYNAKQGVYAAYARVDLPLSSKVSLSGGLRFEAAQQRLYSFDPQQADQPIAVALDTYDPLPSLNLVAKLTPKMNFRAAVSMTVARPEFRELAPFQFTDFFGGELVQGNPQLQRTRIGSADLRWEWFLGGADVIALSAYGKYFDAPIETTISAGGNLIRSFANARAAYNIGGELEARKELVVSERGLRGVSLGGNVSLLYSQVDLEGVAGQQTSKVRALQGQSPFVVNLFAELDRPDWGTQLRVLYNVFGERIDQVGAFGLPDKYEQPRHQLDITVSQKLPSGLSLRLSARNLVNSPVQIIQRGTLPGNDGAEGPKVQETTVRYTTGQTVSLSLSYDL